MNSQARNILIVGRNGQLAWDLYHHLSDIGSVQCIGRPEVDLTDLDTIRNAIRKFKPDILVNAAAYTAVDKAETEFAIAMAVNAEAPRVMAEEANRLNSFFITYSTDYVFDGKKSTPYIETDPTGPLNVYGKSKLAGEHAIAEVSGAYLIFRTSWVYGKRGKNFLRTIVRLAEVQNEIKIVDDQIGAPTWSTDIARATRQIIEQQLAKRTSQSNFPSGYNLNYLSGVYHMTAESSVSWYGFAKAILEEIKSQGLCKGNLATLVPITSEQHHTCAQRPHNSRLSNTLLKDVFHISLPHWRDSLAQVIKDIVAHNKAP